MARFKIFGTGTKTVHMCYAKLPRAFQISTPVGNYSTDWAIAFHPDESADKNATGDIFIRLFLAGKQKWIIFVTYSYEL